MKQKIFCLFLICLFSIGISAASPRLFAIDSARVCPPQEAVVLTLPDAECKNWAVESGTISANESFCNFSPLKPNRCFLDSIFMLSSDRAVLSERQANSIDAIFEYTKKQASSSFPKNKVAFKILEKKNNEIIYEKIVHKSHNGHPLSHKLIRMFFTETVFHVVEFSRTYVKLSSRECAKWVEILKNGVSVLPFDKAENIVDAFSPTSYSNSHFVDLGPVFEGWVPLHSHIVCNGARLDAYHPPIPPSAPDPYRASEFIEILLIPKMPDTTIERQFEKDKDIIESQRRQYTPRANLSKKMDFHVLSQSPNEIIYSCTYESTETADPKRTCQLTQVVRSFLEDKGYYSISYKCSHNEDLKQEEIVRFADMLKKGVVKRKNPEHQLQLLPSNAS